MKKTLKNTLTLLALLFVSFSWATAQQNKPLVVGDTAPEIRFSKWLKGNPVKSIDKNKMYVLEFWATWCGPCIAAMPGLSEFAKKHPEVTVIAFNIWEKVGARPYESALPNVEKFVKSMGDKMAFNVAVDNNEQYISKNWLTNAGISGIPSTFLVKDGKVIWIGGPRELEAIVEAVKNGTYNLAAVEKGSEERRSKVASTIQSQNDRMMPYKQAIAAKDYKTALAELDKLSPNPEADYGVSLTKFTTLLDFGVEKEAVQVARKFLSTTTAGGNTVGNFGIAVADRAGLKPETYLFGVECLQLYISRNQGEPIPLVYDYMAKCYYLAGDYDNAVKNQQTAFDRSRHALATGKGGGRVTKELVAQYEETLKEYQAKANKKKKS